jgi:lipopolysaccharide transport system ATP-binding protein
MTDKIAIRVSNLSKKYELGGPKEQYHSLRDAIANSLKAPFEAFHHSPPSEGFWALKDISFDISKGEVVGIIGRNGAGKSTLLKILSRITTPTEGTIEIHGRVGSLLEVGTGFHPEMTGRENIFLNGSILGMKKTEIEQKFDEIVKFSEIEKFLDTPVKRYSSGMYVRLAFAVAAHLEPDILVVDEVLAVGDASFQKKCLGKMGNIAKEGRTVLFVSHNMAAINSLCKTGILLNKGRLEIFSDIRKVTSYYIQSGNLSPARRQWSINADTPGDEVVRLKSVYITTNNEEMATIPINQEVCIEIEFWNLKEGAQISSSIHLLDKYGAPILASGNLKSATINMDEYASLPYSNGLYKTTCVIPPNFLNNGIYLVNVFLLTDISDIHVQVDEVISFEMVDTGEMSKEYTGGWIGVIRPKLEWHTQKQNEVSK